MLDHCLRHSEQNDDHACSVPTIAFAIERETYEILQDQTRAPYASKSSGDFVKHGHLRRLQPLIVGAFRPPPGRARIVKGLVFGFLVHTIFATAVLSMVFSMHFGMSNGLGTVPWPYAGFANALLLIQFPIVHSVLLTPSGQRLLSRLLPGNDGAVLATTTYAIIASLQLIMLFALWTPSGTIWWSATGAVYWLVITLYAGSWLMLAKASFDAGVEVQSGALGWLSLVQNIAPRFPGMPRTGLFKIIRHPIYVAFALTLWTVPVWTPDQLAVAVSLSAYCLLAPLLKEQRFKKRYGRHFLAYRQKVPYALPFRLSAVLRR